MGAPSPSATGTVIRVPLRDRFSCHFHLFHAAKPALHFHLFHSRTRRQGREVSPEGRGAQDRSASRTADAIGGPDNRRLRSERGAGPDGCPCTSGSRAKLTARHGQLVPLHPGPQPRMGSDRAGWSLRPLLSHSRRPEPRPAPAWTARALPVRCLSTAQKPGFAHVCAASRSTTSGRVARQIGALAAPPNPSSDPSSVPALPKRQRRPVARALLNAASTRASHSASRVARYRPSRRMPA